MITVVDLGTGNIGSVLKALKSINSEIELTNDPKIIEKASKIILPGVSTFEMGMKGVRKYDLLTSLRETVLGKKIPILGICMGMQILASSGEENGTFEGLNFLPGSVVRRLDSKHSLPIPHMGWNNIESLGRNLLFEGLPEKPDFYFVHSYHVTNLPKDSIVNTVDYGEPVTAAISYRNIYGTQFHPEKSQGNGLRVLRNFLKNA